MSERDVSLTTLSSANAVRENVCHYVPSHIAIIAVETEFIDENLHKLGQEEITY